MNNYYLAQINIGRMLAPIGDPLMAEFVAQLPPINALADASPGCVWRLQTESGDATSVKVYDDDRIIVNMSVWESVESLREYAYRSTHTGVMKYRNGSRSLMVPTLRCGGFRRGIFQVRKREKNGWNIYVSMGIRLMLFRSRMYFLSLLSEGEKSICIGVIKLLRRDERM